MRAESQGGGHLILLDHQRTGPTYFNHNRALTVHNAERNGYLLLTGTAAAHGRRQRYAKTTGAEVLCPQGWGILCNAARKSQPFGTDIKSSGIYKHICI